jgi:hypothetical protein
MCSFSIRQMVTMSCILCSVTLLVSPAWALQKGEYTFVQASQSTVAALKPVLNEDMQVHFSDTPAGIIVWQGANGKWRCIGSAAGCLEFMKGITK